jgi:hypothetical protein
MWSFTPVPLFPTTKLVSNQYINFCRFEVVFSVRGYVGLTIILKQGYILHISKTQRKYASSENSVSRTLHLCVLFHQQFALHIWSTESAPIWSTVSAPIWSTVSAPIWSTVSAPTSRPPVQFNGRAPAHDNTERNI